MACDFKQVSVMLLLDGRYDQISVCTIGLRIYATMKTVHTIKRSRPLSIDAQKMLALQANEGMMHSKARRITPGNII